ncbi:MAG TPA: dienelactone hydrolase family protein [Tepidisphaeraceae bacterium]|jgi:dienelactone hydrolase
MDDRDIEARRRQLYSLLGDLPPRDRPIAVLERQTLPSEKYHLEKLLLDLNGIENVPAYFVKPLQSQGKLPTILYNHWHGGQYDVGKEGLIHANRKSPPTSYAELLTQMGYAALCVDHWAFGERNTRSESDIFKDMLWHGQVMWGMMVYDSLRAVDYLVGREDVDANRIGTLGMSMGSTMAYWLAALDERVKICVDICCLTDFQALMDANNLKGHGLYYYVPGLLKHFTLAEINELIVPRPHLGLAGNLDELTPPAGLDRIDAALKKSYADAGVPERWMLVREDVGHTETLMMRKEIVDFLKRWL